MRRRRAGLTQSGIRGGKEGREGGKTEGDGREEGRKGGKGNAKDKEEGKGRRLED